MVRNNNFTLLLTSSDQEWQFHIAADILWSRMAISHCYCHLVVKNGNFTLLLTSGGQEWQFHIATDIWWSRMAITLLLTSSGEEWQLADVLLYLLADLPPECIMGYILWDLFDSHFGFFKKRWKFLLISE